jgi:hypothetical protein
LRTPDPLHRCRGCSYIVLFPGAADPETRTVSRQLQHDRLGQGTTRRPPGGPGACWPTPLGPRPGPAAAPAPSGVIVGRALARIADAAEDGDGLSAVVRAHVRERRADGYGGVGQVRADQFAEPREVAGAGWIIRGLRSRGLPGCTKMALGSTQTEALARGYPHARSR